MVILGIDPGNARCGWGIVERIGSRVSFLACGCIETEKALLPGERLAEIAGELRKVLKRWKPEAAGVEDIFFFKNAKTVVAVAQARGVVLATLAQSKIPQASYTPLQIKQAVAAYGAADKAQVARMVGRILKLSSLPEPDDAADALAVAICHAHSMR